MRRAIIPIVPVILLALGAEASAQQRSGPSVPDDLLPQPLAAHGAPAPALHDSIVALARAQLGRRYVFGGAQPDGGFDCSGLVQYVMRALGIEVPRTAAQQARVGARVPRDTAHLNPGDLLIFGSDTLIEHVGIYVGEGRFIHASSVARRVIESPIRRPPNPLIKPWVAVRRLAPLAR